MTINKKKEKVMHFSVVCFNQLFGPKVFCYIVTGIN